MDEGELVRVQRLAPDAERRCTAVQAVTDQRHCGVREVDADLVRAAAVQRAAKRRDAADEFMTT